MRESAAWPIDVAVDTAILADAQVSAVLKGDKVYSLVAKQGAMLPYIVLGDSAETAFRTFGRAGNDGALTMHIWGTDKRQVLTIHAHLVRILDGARLAVAGHEMVRGRVELVTVLADEDGKAMHGVARYTPMTQVGAP